MSGKHRPFSLALLAMALAALCASPLRAEDARVETAIFAGGCFWCVESDFDVVPGVLETVSGYTGGALADPTYQDVTAGGTGHLESVRITFDPETVSYEELLRVFWRSVDPTDDGGQFCDRGSSYRTAVFATTETQYEAAVASKQALAASGILADPVVTQVRMADAFYDAEDYHQNYYLEHSYRYGFYRLACGRDRRIRDLWGDEAWGGYTHEGS